MPKLIKAVVTGQPVNPDAALGHLFDHHYYGGVPEKAFATTIFDPKLTDLTELPIGVLDQKEELLPDHLIPTSLCDLRAYCERMIIRNGDAQLIETVAERWPGQGSGQKRFDGHIAELWRLRTDHPPLYRALCSGRHRTVVLALRSGPYAGIAKKHGTTLGVIYLERIRRALACQTLLWCAHGVQLVLARIARSVSSPLDLVSSDLVTVEPERVLNDARAWRAVLDNLLDAYWVGGSEEENEERFGNDQTVRLLRAQVRRQARNSGVDVDRAFRGFDDFLSISKRLADTSDNFLRKTAMPRTTNAEPKSFSALWFSGLSTVVAASVVILRCVQAEAQVNVLIEELIPMKGF